MEIGLPSGEYRKGVSKAGSIGARQPHSDRRGWREGPPRPYQGWPKETGSVGAPANIAHRMGGYWGATLLGLALQVLVVEVPFLQDAFGTTALTLVQWGN
jgi:hypothetical protein